VPCILVVDDKDDVRATIGMVLRLKGFEVVGAESGKVGIKEFENSKFNLVIVDIFLQGILDGIEVIKLSR
jgi:DNA-binding response OmpR family regulator